MFSGRLWDVGDFVGIDMSGAAALAVELPQIMYPYAFLFVGRPKPGVEGNARNKCK